MLYFDYVLRLLLMLCYAYAAATSATDMAIRQRYALYAAAFLLPQALAPSLLTLLFDDLLITLAFTLRHAPYAAASPLFATMMPR